MKLHPVLLCAALAVAPWLGAASVVKAADVVVTASTAAAVSPGLMLKPDASLVLADGERVTLFGPNGLVDVDGPYSGAVSAAVGGASSQSSAIARVVKRRKRIASLAASRGGAVSAEDSTHHLHLLSDGVWCVDGAAPPLYIRAERKDRIVTMIGSDGARHEMLWPRDSASEPWPASAPFTPGATYQLMIGDIQMPLDLSLVTGPSGGPDGPRLAAYLSAGCAAQADALMNDMAGG